MLNTPKCYIWGWHGLNHIDPNARWMDYPQRLQSPTQDMLRTKAPIQCLKVLHAPRFYAHLTLIFLNSSAMCLSEVAGNSRTLTICRHDRGKGSHGHGAGVGRSRQCGVQEVKEWEQADNEPRSHPGVVGRSWEVRLHISQVPKTPAHACSIVPPSLTKYK